MITFQSLLMLLKRFTLHMYLIHNNNYQKTPQNLNLTLQLLHVDLENTYRCVKSYMLVFYFFVNLVRWVLSEWLTFIFSCHLCFLSLLLFHQGRKGKGSESAEYSQITKLVYSRSHNEPCHPSLGLSSWFYIWMASKGTEMWSADLCFVGSVWLI